MRFVHRDDIFQRIVIKRDQTSFINTHYRHRLCIPTYYNILSTFIIINFSSRTHTFVEKTIKIDIRSINGANINFNAPLHM